MRTWTERCATDIARFIAQEYRAKLTEEDTLPDENGEYDLGEVTAEIAAIIDRYARRQKDKR